MSIFWSGRERVNDDRPYKEIIMPQKMSLRIEYIYIIVQSNITFY